MVKEEFKPLIFPGIQKDRYLISNYGKVFDLKFQKIKHTESRDKDGYVRIKLRDICNNEINIGVHRLVAWEFVKGYDLNSGKIIPNHLDNIKDNNYFGNLEWVTHSENDLHAIKHGNRKNIGADNNTSIFSEDLVIKVCKLLEKGFSNHKIMKEFGYKNHKENKLLYKLIFDLKYKNSWSHITISPSPATAASPSIVGSGTATCTPASSPSTFVRKIRSISATGIAARVPK
jgi:hypothetical protein